MSKPERRLTIELPREERGMGAGEIRRLDKLLRQLSKPDLTPDVREDIAKRLARMEGTIRAENERAGVEDAITDSLIHAMIRGEEVETPKAGRAIRIMSRGGLTQAFEDGHLEPVRGSLKATDTYEAGKRYRDAYEVAEGLTTSTGGGGGFGPKAPQPRLVEAGEALKAMRAAITDRQRAVLDLVCGQDVRLRTAATQLHRGFPSTKLSLRGGLTAIAGLKLERRNVGEALKAKTEAISRAQNAA